MGSLSPQAKKLSGFHFREETVDYLVATDAIGIGSNLNIKNISFSSLNKFDGKENRLKNSEIGQLLVEREEILSGSFSTTLMSEHVF